MRRSLLSTAAVALVLAVSVPAEAQQQPRGMGASLLLGANMCIEQGDAKCDGVDPSFGMALGGLYRTGEYFAWTLDFTLGMYDTEAGDVQNLGMFGGGRLYIPVGNLAFFAGAALGWGQWSIDIGTVDTSDNHLALAFQGGAEFYIIRNLAIGAWFRYQMPVFGEEHHDERIDFDEYPHQVIVGGGGTYYF